MNKKEALEASVIKYKKVVEILQKSIGKVITRKGNGPYTIGCYSFSLSSKNCPLCGLYNTCSTGIGQCKKCPVYARTQQILCQGTPYTLLGKVLAFCPIGVNDCLIQKFEEQITFLESLNAEENID